MAKKPPSKTTGTAGDGAKPMPGSRAKKTSKSTLGSAVDEGMLALVGGAGDGGMPSSRRAGGTRASGSGAISGAGSAMPLTPEYPCPIALSEILGQDPAVSVLHRAMKSGRLHHAWIFHGPAGVGKFTTALAFAAAILDPTTRPNLSGAIEPDPDSPTQKLLRSGGHPDLHVVTKELARFHEDKSIRDAKLITIPKPVIEKYVLEPSKLAASVRSDAMAAKVFIIDEAELLDRSPTHAPVQNALLKTLEEPPERTVIILVTASEDRLLPTIRSRSQRVSFQELDHGAMSRWIERWESGRPEGSASIDDDQRNWLMRFSGGSPGVFQTAFDTGLHAWHAKLAPLVARVIRGDYPVEMTPAMESLSKEWSETWVKQHQNASKDAANKAAADWLFRYLGNELRSNLRTAVAGGDLARAELFASGIERIRTAEGHIDSNVAAVFALDGLVADLSALFAGDEMEVA